MIFDVPMITFLPPLSAVLVTRTSPLPSVWAPVAAGSARAAPPAHGQGPAVRGARSGVSRSSSWGEERLQRGSTAVAQMCDQAARAMPCDVRRSSALLS